MALKVENKPIDKKLTAEKKLRAKKKCQKKYRPSIRRRRKDRRNQWKLTRSTSSTDYTCLTFSEYDCLKLASRVSKNFFVKHLAS